MCPAGDLGGYRVGDVVEFGVLFEDRVDHGAHRDNPFAGIASGIQRFFKEDGCQTTSTELWIDDGVVENPLLATVGEVGVADGFAVDGDGVRLMPGGDGGFSAGLIDGHVYSLSTGGGVVVADAAEWLVAAGRTVG